MFTIPAIWKGFKLYKEVFGRLRELKEVFQRGSKKFQCSLVDKHICRSMYECKPYSLHSDKSQAMLLDLVAHFKRFSCKINEDI